MIALTIDNKKQKFQWNSLISPILCQVNVIRTETVVKRVHAIPENAKICETWEKVEQFLVNHKHIES